jgi:GDP-4-dehydro-6-deoxy-D-mannose reductase
MRVLVTGISGFAGRHLAELLAQQPDLELHGLVRGQRCSSLPSKIQLHNADLLDEPALRSVLWLVQPQQIYHVAGYANPAGSFREAWLAWEANLTATLNLYDACLSELAEKPRILFVSSGAVYAELVKGEMITEDSALGPRSPYATSKCAADLASYQYWITDRLPIIRIRPFNQVGAGQSPHFALGRFAEQLVRMEMGKQEPVLRVGNLEAERDFTDVRDMVRAYALLMQKGEPGHVYVAGSGQSRSMRWYLEQLLHSARVDVRVETDSTLLRPSEVQKLRINSQKLQELTGWIPQIPIRQTIDDLLNSYREIMSRGPTAS